MQKNIIAAAAHAIMTNIDCVRTPISPSVKIIPLTAMMRFTPVASRTQSPAHPNRIPPANNEIRNRTATPSPAQENPTPKPNPSHSIRTEPTTTRHFNAYGISRNNETAKTRPAARTTPTPTTIKTPHRIQTRPSGNPPPTTRSPVKTSPEANRRASRQNQRTNDRVTTRRTASQTPAIATDALIPSRKPKRTPVPLLTRSLHRNLVENAAPNPMAPNPNPRPDPANSPPKKARDNRAEVKPRRVQRVKKGKANPGETVSPSPIPHQVTHPSRPAQSPAPRRKVPRPKVVIPRIHSPPTPKAPPANRKRPRAVRAKRRVARRQKRAATTKSRTPRVNKTAQRPRPKNPAASQATSPQTNPATRVVKAHRARRPSRELAAVRPAQVRHVKARILVTTFKKATARPADSRKPNRSTKTSARKRPTSCSSGSRTNSNVARLTPTF